MKIYYDNMQYRDVVMANYIINLNKPEQFQDSQKDFMEYAGKKGTEYKGPFTYYIEGVNRETVRVHYIMQVSNWHYIQDNRLAFQSYYGYDKMICTRVKVEELNNMELIINTLVKRAHTDGYTVYGPLYYVLSKVPNDEVIYLKMPITK